MRIIYFEENKKNQWNKFIAENYSESFLQSWEWGSFQESLGRRIWRIGVVEDRGFHSGISPVEPKMQDLHMRFHSPNGTMEPSECKSQIPNPKSQINSKFKIPSPRLVRLGQKNSKFLALALIVKYDLPFGKSYLYCPRGPVTGNWKLETGNWKVLDLLFCEIKKIAGKEKAMFLRIDPATPLTPTLSRGEREKWIKKSPNEVQPRDTLMLDLTKSEEELLKEMKQKTRYNIRLAEKKGIKITNLEYRILNLENFKKGLDKFWELIEETSARDKFASHNKNYYWKMLEILNNEGDIRECRLRAKLYLAEYENKIIASNIVLYFGALAVYLHGASSGEYRNAMAPHLLQWRQILDAKKAGCEKYDFWGIKSMVRQAHHDNGVILSLSKDKKNNWQGITRFKKGFGGEEKNYIGAYDAVFDNIGYAAYRFIKFVKVIYNL